MQKICIGILMAIFVIIFVINVTAWDYFPPNEWNFDYKRTYCNRNGCFSADINETTEMYDDH